MPLENILPQSLQLFQFLDMITPNVSLSTILLSAALFTLHTNSAANQRSHGDDSGFSKSLPSSCVGQQDGYRWLKLLDGDEYPAVHQLCSNGMMVIDVNEDPNVKAYFSSFVDWHYALSGTDIMDTANWEEWWLPSAQFLDSVDGENEEYFRFAIAPDCGSCDTANNLENNEYALWNDDEYGDRTAYYMNGKML